jgi:hypothetical protein
MAQTTSADPPELTPPAGDPSAGAEASPPPGPKKRRRMSGQTRVALIGVAGAVLAAIIGLFATDTVTVIVPPLGIGPDVTAIQEDNDRLRVEKETLSLDAGALEATNEELSGTNEDLQADNKRLRGKLEEVGVDPDEPATTRTEVYADREFELIGSDDGDRVAFLDLDTGDVDEMLDNEWTDTVESDGPFADLAIVVPSGDALAWSGLGVWSSSSGAPATPVACEEKASASNDELVFVSDLAPGDVLCMVTTDDALARVEIVSANSDDSPARVEVNVSLWK